LRQYVDGLLGDSARRSMSAMLERISEPTSWILDRRSGEGREPN
jgi:hypothetical protein